MQVTLHAKHQTYHDVSRLVIEIEAGSTNPGVLSPGFVEMRKDNNDKATACRIIGTLSPSPSPPRCSIERDGVVSGQTTNAGNKKVSSPPPPPRARSAMRVCVGWQRRLKCHHSLRKRGNRIPAFLRGVHDGGRGIFVLCGVERTSTSGAKGLILLRGVKMLSHPWSVQPVAVSGNGDPRK